MSLIKETITGFWSLLTGMRITIKEFFSPTITTHYPRQTLPIPKKFRGHIELKWNEETGRANCTACGICAKACPSKCIELSGIKPAGEKGKAVTNYHLDYTLCSLCSLCVEACPFDAIQHSGRYNLASVPNQWKDMDLFERYKQQVERVGKTPFIPQPEPAAPKPAAAAAVSDKVQVPSATPAPSAKPAATEAPSSSAPSVQQ
jgi:NADH-quinone oxidoreductase subunit I